MTAFVAVSAFLAQLLIFDRSVVFMDEGQLGTIASRLLNGEVLYRDIYTGVFPAAYYLAAGLFAAFGQDLVVLRWAQLVLNTIIAGLLFLIAARVARLRWALIAPALYVTLVFVDFPGLSMWNYSALAMACALFALFFLSSFAARGGAVHLVLAGLWAGATFLCKQNFGVFASIALVGVLVALLWSRSPSLSKAIWQMLPFAGVELAVAAALPLYFGLHRALPAFLESTFLTLFGTQLATFNNPIPPLLGALPLENGRFTFLYLPPSLFNYLIRGEALAGYGITPLTRLVAIKLSYAAPLALLLAAPAIAYATRKRVSAKENRITAAVCVFAGFLFLGIFPSAIWSHLAFVLAPVFVLAAIVADRIDALIRFRFTSMIWGVAVAAFVGLGLAVAVRIGLDMRRWYPEPLGLERASLLVSAHQRSLLQGAVDFVQDRTRVGDPIFVAPDIPIVYFLTDRRNPTPYDLIIPGDVREEVILDRLRQTQPACAVYNPKMYPEFPAFDVLFPRVRSYLREEYDVETVISGDGTEWQGLSKRTGEPRA